MKRQSRPRRERSSQGPRIPTANPLENIANSRKINRVYLRGQEVDRAALRAKWQARWIPREKGSYPFFGCGLAKSGTTPFRIEGVYSPGSAIDFTVRLNSR